MHIFLLIAVFKCITTLALCDFYSDACKNLRAPANGRLNCSSSDNRETRCIVACEDGYDLAIEPTNVDIVNDELLLSCNSSSHTWESNHLPECSSIYVEIIYVEHRSFGILNECIKLWFLLWTRNANAKDSISGGERDTAKQRKRDMRQSNCSSRSKRLYLTYNIDL